MDELKQLEDKILQASATSADTQTEATQADTPTETATEDPIQAELNKVRSKPREDKEIFSFKKIAESLKEKGKDPAEILGFKKEEESGQSEEDKPVTQKDLQKLISQIQKAPEKKAVELVTEMQEDVNRKELMTHYIENVINPNLSENEKFEIAKTMVNGILTQKVQGITSLRPEVKTHSSASSIELPKGTDILNQPLTAEEQYLLNASKGVLTKEEIIKQRAKKR